MATNDSEYHKQCMQRFIDLANTMKNEGVPTRVISAALMTASGVYTTYTVAGNSGGLNESGIDKVTDAYRQNLLNIQQAKREELQQKQQQQ
ncbi:DUF3144 domain-containing protein [Parahaliea mediterranea]|uniref:DUF3144 domain-containing protein n=1 Tax=Parahaliea mediterranea TaxID=651086 RepID=A0A939DDC5_9GAMM|nr:DUF3144 domain-containing protein [Parahaliea mediterranea]MBN7796000.1 DUF3144 domain-containing protein [Parahaliea mediterranea]